MKIEKINNKLINDLVALIEENRQKLSYAANATMTLTYWHVGKRINEDILDNKRAEYGKQIVVSVTRQLTAKYGRSFEEKNLRRMIQFYNRFSDFENVATLWRHLTWSHFKMLIPIKDELQREFYAQLCRTEGWNVKTLRLNSHPNILKTHVIKMN